MVLEHTWLQDSI